MKTIDLTKDFDSPRDSSNYIDMLARNGTLYEYVDEDTIIVFEDQTDHEKWLEIASEPGSFFEKQVQRDKARKLADVMLDDKLDDLL